jgi:3-hydroxyisobutyrate dehydrogenase-like beta-hydroxyacid dehydrogenase
MTEIAILGTGRMGTAMARRLLATGHQVTVWDRAREGASGLVDAGAEVAAAPDRAVAGAGLVIVMLADAVAVDVVLFGPDGAAAAMRPGAVLAQMSTIGPDEVGALAARLPASVSLLDAPVGGSVGAAESGTLVIFAGGPPAVLAIAEPVLRHLGTVRHLGPIGAGAATKLVVNTAMLTTLGALHDTLAVADAVGLNRKDALDTLAGGPLAGAIKRATATGASFAISMAAKDLGLALREARTVPVAAAVLGLLRGAPDQRADLAALIDLEIS